MTKCNKQSPGLDSGTQKEIGGGGWQNPNKVSSLVNSIVQMSFFNCDRCIVPMQDVNIRESSMKAV